MPWGSAWDELFYGPQRVAKFFGFYIATDVPIGLLDRKVSFRDFKFIEMYNGSKYGTVQIRIPEF